MSLRRIHRVSFDTIKRSDVVYIVKVVAMVIPCFVFYNGFGTVHLYTLANAKRYRLLSTHNKYTPQDKILSSMLQY